MAPKPFTRTTTPWITLLSRAASPIRSECCRCHQLDLGFWAWNLHPDPNCPVRLISKKTGPGFLRGPILYGARGVHPTVLPSWLHVVTTITAVKRGAVTCPRGYGCARRGVGVEGLIPLKLEAATVPFFAKAHDSQVPNDIGRGHGVV